MIRARQRILVSTRPIQYRGYCTGRYWVRRASRQAVSRKATTAAARTPMASQRVVSGVNMAAV